MKENETMMASVALPKRIVPKIPASRLSDEVQEVKPEEVKPSMAKENESYTSSFLKVYQTATASKHDKFIWCCRNCMEDARQTVATLRATWIATGDVPTGCYSSNSFNAMKRHRDQHLSDPGTKLHQRPITQYFMSKQEKRENEINLVRFVCAMNLSVSCVDNPTARAVMRNQLRCLGGEEGRNKVRYRNDLRKLIISEKERLKKDLKTKLKDKAVLLAVDGGTIERASYMNVVIAADGASYFYASRLCRDQMKAEWIQSELKEVLTELRKLGIQVMAICADNASNYQKALTQLSGGLWDPALEEDPNPPSEESDAEEESEESEREGEEEEEEDESEPEVEDQFRSTAGFIQSVESAILDTTSESLKDFSCLVAVRCYAHTFQLVVGDMMKNFEAVLKVATRIQTAFKEKENREKIRRIATLQECQKRTIHRSCATRWNSTIRTLVDILSLRTVLTAAAQESPHPENSQFYISDADYRQIEQAVLVLCPLGWATDIVQSDSFSVQDCARLIATVEEKYAILKKHFEGKATMVNLITKAEARLNARKLYLHNRLFKTFKTLTEMGNQVRTNAPKDEEVRDMESLMLDYLRDAAKLGETPEDSWLCKKFPDLIPFRTSADPEAAEKLDDKLRGYMRHELKQAQSKSFAGWEESTCILVRSFLSDLSTLIVTEAAVERSFQCQAEIQRPRRCKMHPELADAILFIRMNMDKLNYFPSDWKHKDAISSRNRKGKTKEQRKKNSQKRSVLPEADWKCLMEKCGSGEWLPERVITRRQKHNAKIARLKLGSRVKIQWLEGSTNRRPILSWYCATVTHKVSQFEFKVVYDDSDEAVQFLPQSKDLRFEIIE